MTDTTITDTLPEQDTTVQDVATSLDYDEKTAENGSTIEADTEGLDAFTAEMDDQRGQKPASESQQATATSPEASTPAVEQSGDVDMLRSQAQQFGFTAEEVQSLDRGTLQALVESQSRLAFGMQQPQAFGAPQPWQQQPGSFGFPPMQPPQQQAGYQQPNQQPQQGGNQQYKVGLDPNEFDERLLNEMNAMNSYYQQQMQHMQGALAAMQQQQMAAYQAMQQQQAAARDEALSRDFDNWIAKKGDAFVPLFGGESIKPNSPQHRARAAVYAAADAMLQQAAVSGIPVNMEFIREQAAKQVLGSQYDYFNQQALRQPAAQRQSQMTQRANGQSRKPQAAGRDKAGDTAEQFFRERGLL